MDGYRYMVERNKLLIWMEAEKDKLSELPAAEKIAGVKRLEAEFDRRLAGLHEQVQGIFAYEKEASDKKNG